MRKINLLIIIVGMLLSVQSAAAQKSLRQVSPKAPKQTLKTTFSESQAFSDGENGALIEWRTSYEVRNLGFNIYRLDENQKIPVNKEIIAGSALMVGENTALPAGYSYNFFDAEGSLLSQYVIEAVGMNGQIESVLVSTQFAANVVERSGRQQSKTLDQLGRAGSTDATLQNEFPVPPATKEFIELNEAVQNSQTQRWIAAQPGAKIGVKKEGFYRVTRAELQAAGFNVNAPIENWQLYTDGIEQAINIGGNGDYIEFYGRSIDTLTSDVKTYYLVVGTSPGKRIALGRKFSPSRVTAPNFAFTAERRDRTIYAQGILNGDVENFFGTVVTSSSAANLALDLKAVDASAAQAVVQVSIQGFSNQQHNFKVTLNGTELGFIPGNSYDLMQKQFTVPGSLLNQGANTLQIIGTAPTSDIGLMHFARISYTRRYEADANKLTFTTGFSRATRISGFTTPDVRVFDITDPNNTALAGFVDEGSGNILVGAYRPRLMHAIADTAVMQAASVTANAPSNVLDTALNKNLVIITHANWMTAAQNLATYRAGQGLTVAVVNVEDVFDECDFGQSSTQAIRSFLQAVQPQYALLFGDGSADPKNYYNRGFHNYVPTRLVDTLFQEAPSDDALVDYNNDNIADFPIGRIPVRDAATAQLIVNKIITYEAGIDTALMSKGGVFICDEPEGYDFCGAVQRLRNQLPAGMPAQFIQRADGDVQTVRTSIVNSVNAGKHLIVYAGHGSLSAWSSTSIFRSADVSLLTNANQLPLFLPLNCLNGAFADIFSDSLGEVMVKHSNGGAVAAWSSSGLTFPDTQELMSTRFFNSVGGSEFARLGDAIKMAKQSTPDRDVRLSWILLGDPTLKIR